MAFLSNISRAFKHKNYRYYFVWQFLSFVGTWIQGTAQSWLVYRLTGSAFYLGLISFAGSLPSLIFAPFSGVVSDHFKRRNVLIFTQAICLLQGIVLAFLFFSNLINVWHVLFLAVLLGIANSFDVTARQSFIPLLVSNKDLINAIALNSTMFNTARMVGPLVAGILIATFSEGICFVLNVLSYLPIIGFLLWVRSKEQIVKKVTSPIIHLKEGFCFAWRNNPIRSLLLLIGTFSFWGMSFSTLLPIFSDKVLHSGAKGLGILMAASGIGAICGGLFLASREKILGIKKIIALCSILFSLSLFGFSFSNGIVASVVFLVIIGFCFMIINAGSNTTMQALSPDYIRGRIIGLYSMMFMGMFPLGSLTIGTLAHFLGEQYAVAICSVVCILVSFYFSLVVPRLTKEAESLFFFESKD